MSQSQDLLTLDRLPALVNEFRAVQRAATCLAEADYAGADMLAQELDLALEALDGAPGALLYLAGVVHACGDAAAFERWDSGLAGRINLRDLP